MEMGNLILKARVSLLGKTLNAIKFTETRESEFLLLSFLQYNWDYNLSWERHANLLYVAT